jgi:hypothetical protein
MGICMRCDSGAIVIRLLATIHLLTSQMLPAKAGEDARSTYKLQPRHFTKVYKIRRNFPEFSGLIFLHTPENNRVSKEKR